MLYKFQNNKLMIMDITTSKEFTFNVPGIVEIDFVTANKQRTLIAFTAFDYNHESKGIYICDLIEESIRQIVLTRMPQRGRERSITQCLRSLRDPEITQKIRLRNEPQATEITL